MQQELTGERRLLRHCAVLVLVLLVLVLVLARRCRVQVAIVLRQRTRMQPEAGQLDTGQRHQLFAQNRLFLDDAAQRAVVLL